MKIAVTGAGGFIGHHLVKRLKADGHWVRGIDIKPPEYEPSPADEFWRLDLRDWEYTKGALIGCEWVFHLAANMGGIGFIEANRAEIVRDNTQIDLNMLESARAANLRRFLFTSSACVYPAYLQATPDVLPLRESDAYPADPEDGYGWEKLYMERMCRHWREDWGLDTRIVRLHNVYGPCFDKETEVLTRSGFKKFEDLSFDDEILTLNRSDGTMEYHRPLAIQRYMYNGPMYRIKMRDTLDLLITPDHSVYFSTRIRGKRKLKPFSLGKIKDIKQKTIYFCRGGRWVGSDVSTYTIPASSMVDGRKIVKEREKTVPMDLWLEFLGRYLSGGSSVRTPTNYVVNITQYDKEARKEIADIVRHLGFHPYICRNDVKIHSKQLYDEVSKLGKAHDKHIPRELLSLPPEKLRILFTSLCRGDGSKGRNRYSTVSKRLADDVCEMLLKLGYGVKVRLEAGGASPIYRVEYSDVVVNRIDPKHRSIEMYAGPVYDVTVPNHVLMVRRNGKTVWSGNCGTYDGGREKSPAAICRKVALARDGDEIEVWGDGKQTRSYCYVDDAVDGIVRVMMSGYVDPVNIGSNRLVTIDELVDMVARIAGKTVRKRYNVGKAQGVRGRNCDSTLAKNILGWVPSTPLEVGLERTYHWIEGELRKAGRL